MPREGNHLCAACEQAFGSKWAMQEHARSCPARRNAELVRAAEALAWKQEQIERAVGLCYRYAARAFAAHHSGRADEARLFRKWLVDDLAQGVTALAELGSGLREARRVQFPRLGRMNREVGTLLEQASELQNIGGVLRRLFD